MVLLPALFAAPLAAQDPALADAQALAAARVPIRTAPADPVGGPYGTWAAGPTYKVSFHGDMTFVPVLGSDYPHNQSLGWRTTSVRVGATELLGRGETAARHATDFRYEYRYRHFVEAYDVLERGVEQTFVLRDRPAASGDLVVTGRLTTDLSSPRLDSAHQEVESFPGLTMHLQDLHTNSAGTAFQSTERLTVEIIK